MRSRVIAWLYTILLSAIVLIPGAKLAFGKNEALFSPQDKIKEKIIESVNSAQHTIEIAVFIFKSGDIAESLLSAKKRNVNIRILLDAKQGRNQNIILDFLEDEGFNIQYLKGRVGGFMHNTFAIFDGKLVITGSYNWTEHSEKFNYENIILTDNSNIVDQFQKEFDILFAKSIKKASRKNSSEYIQASSNDRELDVMLNQDEPVSIKPSEEKSPAKKGNSTNLQRAESYTKEQQSITRRETQIADIETKSLPENYLNISFEAFDDMFGPNSRMSNDEKKEIWKNKFRGKYVKWKGKVKYMGVSMYDWNKIGIIHNDGEGKANVQLKVDWTMKDKVRALKLGYIITYTGKLESLAGLSSTYKLVNCNILDVER